MRRYKKFRQERRRQYVSQIQTATTDLNEGVARLEVGVENDSDLLAKREDEVFPPFSLILFFKPIS